jgi:APA family basic amino acid/polyamine antiporter
VTLRREIGFVEAASYGIGVILGAGIYALVGKAAAEAGNAVWISFLIGTLIATTTGLSYVELASMYPSAAAEYVYVLHAYRRNWLAFLTGWSMLFAQILAAATVALGFAGYFSGLFAAPIPIVAMILVALLSVLIVSGTEESVRVGMLFMIIEVIGLLVVIALGLPRLGNTNLLEAPTGLFGVLAGSALVFFAFIGFENIANLAEEATSPQKVIPRAIIFSMLVCAVLYILVSISAISLVGWQALGISSAPLADAVAASLGGQSYTILSVIALFATANTVLAVLITGSRILYGMAKRTVLPPALGRVGKTRATPTFAILTTLALTSVLVLTGDIRLLAEMTSFGALFAFTLVNASLIRLRRTEPSAHRPFKVPFSVGPVPLPTLAAIVSCLVLLARFDPYIVVLGSPFIALGFVLYFLQRQKSHLAGSESS